MINKHLTQAAPDDTAAVLLLDGNAGRVAVTIQNVSAVDCWLGPDATVDEASGILLKAGGLLSEEAPACSQDSWWARTAASAGATDLRIVEVF